MIAALLLASLAVVDAGFCGFRDAAGRDRRIAKRPYYRAAIGRGMGLGLGVVALFAVAVGALVAVTADGGEVWSDLLGVAARMVVVYGSYATLVIGALGIYQFGSGDLRALGTVAVLGPFTLIRPVVIAGGASWAVLAANHPATVIVACAAALSMILFQPALEALRD